MGRERRMWGMVCLGIRPMADAENCPLCRAPATRRSCRPDDFMARLVASVVGTCRQLREGEMLELDRPFDEAMPMGTAPFSTRADEVPSPVEAA